MPTTSVGIPTASGPDAQMGDISEPQQASIPIFEEVPFSGPAATTKESNEFWCCCTWYLLATVSLIFLCVGIEANMLPPPPHELQGQPHLYQLNKEQMDEDDEEDEEIIYRPSVVKERKSWNERFQELVAFKQGLAISAMLILFISFEEQKV